MLINNYTLFLIICIISLIIGSFISLASFRIPIILERKYNKTLISKYNKHKFYNLVIPRSNCPQCLNIIPLYQNIPLFSYIALRAKCNNCKKPISIRYPIIELVTLLVFILTFFQFGLSLDLIAIYIFACLLITVSIIDIEHGLLPDIITIPILIVGILFNYLFLGVTEFYSSLIGAICGYYSLWIIYKIHHFFTNREGLGYGDFKLMAGLGAWISWQFIPFILFFSSILGIFYSIFLIMFKKHTIRSTIPFGPFLAIVGFFTFLYKQELLVFYLLYL